MLKWGKVEINEIRRWEEDVIRGEKRVTVDHVERGIFYKAFNLKVVSLTALTSL